MRSPRGNTERTALIPDVPSGTIQTGFGDETLRPIGEDSFWTVKELARYLHISERWIHERTRRDEIPCHRLGTALRFDPREVHLWMIQRRGPAVGGRGGA